MTQSRKIHTDTHDVMAATGEPVAASSTRWERVRRFLVSILGGLLKVGERRSGATSWQEGQELLLLLQAREAAALHDRVEVRGPDDEVIGHVPVTRVADQHWRFVFVEHGVSVWDGGSGMETFKWPVKCRRTLDGPRLFVQAHDAAIAQEAGILVGCDGELTRGHRCSPETE